jgi:hypothetical protein
MQGLTTAFGSRLSSLEMTSVETVSGTQWWSQQCGIST